MVRKNKTKHTPSEIRTMDAEVAETATYLLPLSNVCIHRPRLLYLYVLIDDEDIVISVFAKMRF